MAGDTAALDTDVFRSDLRAVMAAGRRFPVSIFPTSKGPAAMATDDTTTDDTTTQDDPPAETATGKTGADPTTDKATEALKAENERIKKALAETNRKAAADRKFREDVERERQQAEDAKLGESEQLRKQLKALEAEKRAAEQESAQLKADLVERRIDTEIERAATGHFLHPEIASQVVDRERITHDPDTGKISGIKDAIDAVLKKYPGLGTAQRGGGSPAAMRQKRPEGGGGQGGGNEKQADLRTEFARMGGYEPL
jgi:flagellar biosynthesis GTPase FlhF